jgi:hypothetical protein
MILSNNQEPNFHIKCTGHQKLIKEYSLSIQEASNTKMLFKIFQIINENSKQKE